MRSNEDSGKFLMRIKRALKTAYELGLRDTVHLIMIGALILIPEFFRYVACKATFQPYRPPHARIVQEVEDER